MNESRMASDVATEPGSDPPTTYRLVIRAEILPDAPSEAVQPHTFRRTLVWVVAGLAALLMSIWIGISMLRNDSRSLPATNEAPRTAPVVPAPTLRDPGATVPRESPTPTLPEPAPTLPIEPSSTRSQPDEPPKPTHQIIPNVPPSALQTIRGTIRVIVRVTIAKQGNVTDVTSEEPGPSRYFERLSLAAAKDWTFSSATSDEPRSMVVRFHYTREGPTASASPRE